MADNLFLRRLGKYLGIALHQGQDCLQIPWPAMKISARTGEYFLTDSLQPAWLEILPLGIYAQRDSFLDSKLRH